MSERYQRGEPLAKAAQRLRELADEAPAKEAAARLAMTRTPEQHIVFCPYCAEPVQTGTGYVSCLGCGQVFAVEPEHDDE